jgi:CRP-like cAMP-binding protein
MGSNPELDVIGALIDGSPRCNHRSGGVIIRQGDVSGHVVVILDGQVKVRRIEKNGEGRILAFLGPDELIGRSGVLEGRRRFAQVEALGRCKVAVVPAQKYLALTNQVPRYRHVAAHIRERLVAVEIIQGDADPLTRLAFALARIAESCRLGGGPTAKAELRCSRTDLGRHLGMNRNNLSSLLKELEGVGVYAARSRITITDLQALREIAGELEI